MNMDDYAKQLDLVLSSGKRFTVDGIEQYLQEKERKRLEYQRTEWEIEKYKIRMSMNTIKIIMVFFFWIFRKYPLTA